MNSSIANVFKTLVPGSGAFLLLGLTVGVILLSLGRRGRRWGLGWVAAVAVTYLALSLPWVANHLAAALYRYPSMTTKVAAREASTIVVFDGDHRSGRVREAIRLQRLIEPQRVIASGPRDFRDALLEAGVPANGLFWQYQASTTREQALELVPWLREHQIDRVVLVASPLHMPRALGAMREVGVEALPAPSARPHAALPRVGWHSVIPQCEALRLSYESLYEHLALVYYRRRGWMASISSS